MLEKLFKLKENKTDVKTEVLAGVTTFMTMAYILAVNPSILGDAGMNTNAVLLATAIASFIGCVCMAFMANYPFALAPGMGLNAYFTYTVVIGMGVSWQTALLAVFIEGVVFIVLSLTNVREAIFNAIPLTLKTAVSAGIGLFIAFIGLQNAKIVVNSDSTLVTYQAFRNNFSTEGVTAVLAIIGIVVTAYLVIKKVKGDIFFGIIITWALGMLMQAVGIYVPNPEAGWYSLYPNFSAGIDFASIGETFGAVFQADIAEIGIGNLIIVVFAFLFVDVFDTLGTLIGVASKADMLDAEGKLPRAKGALMADAVGTTAGAVLGTSTVTTFVESASGVSAGGRTGLTAIVTGFLFLISIVLSPLFLSIPSLATAPALIVVGFYMMCNVVKINFDDYIEAIPAYLTVLFMPIMYSISEGIVIGVIAYTVLCLITGKTKKKKLSPLMYILTILFICKYIFL